MRQPSVVALFFCISLQAQNQIQWTRWSAPDGAFAMQQPAGWAAKYGRTNVHFSNAARDEEIVVIRLPRDASKTAADYVNAVSSSFQRSLASFQMSNLTTAQDSAAFLVTYKSGAKTYSGPGVVVLKGGAAWWVSYGSPSAADLTRGAALVAGVGQSVADAGAAAPALAPAPASSAGSAMPPSLVGNWGTVGYYGDLVNPSTGTFVQSSYSGEWYKFGADGAYQYTIAGSGRIITGVVMCHGTYEVHGDTVQLHQKTESWYPMPNDATRKPKFENKPTPAETTLRIETRGPAEIVIHQGTSASTFHRDPKSK
jgi:hypothetical protein